MAIPLLADRVLTVTWDKHPENATTEIYQVVPEGEDKKLGSIPTIAGNPPEEMVITIPDGETKIYAVAVNDSNPNAIVTSDKSELLVIPKKPSSVTFPRLKFSMKIVEIQTSSNMKEWETLAYIPIITQSPARFLRSSISEVKP